ncbi:polysaccharide biosynthesis protein [Bacteroidota bacterium]
MILSRQNIPGWVIFIIDILIVTFSLILAYLLRFNFSIPQHELDPLPIIAGIILVVRSFGFILARTYASIIRYTSTRDAIRIFIVCSAGSLIFVGINIITFYIKEIYFIPFSIIIIELITTVFVLISFRILVKIAYLELQNPSREKSNVIIFGAGEAGLIAKRALDRDAGSKIKVLAFVDDDQKKSGKKLEGVSIFPYDKLKKLLESNDIINLIIAVQKIKPERKQEIVEKCLAKNIKVMTVPPVAKWINGELSFKQIKEVKIEDLMERDIIKLDAVKIENDLRGKTILITGAAGSIGSEIVRQVSKYPCKSILMLDIAETPLYYLDLEILESQIESNHKIILNDIRDLDKMNSLFKKYKPDIVYHAAAYKHVPMLENNPQEAIITNVNGTRNIADLSVKYNVEKFVMVSTDKAVNPTSIMGASKRIAEIYTQALNQKGKTRFITTRFGNVLGSNGSVIPLFSKQIQKGGPITITHPDITRFFMTIPEACQLVLEAGSMGNGGEIYIFDMGKSMKILDVAKKMIKLSGLTLGKDIQIIYTGLRPGEKLYEELLNKQENTLPTHNPLILIAKVKEYDLKTITDEVDQLFGKIDSSTNFEIVKTMKKIVPEFISKNSIYEQLDHTE